MRYMRSIKSVKSVMALTLIGLLGLAVPSVSADQHKETYTPVTNERLLHPEPENWLMYRGTYNSWGVDAQRKQAMLNSFYETNTYVPQGGVLWVFAVRE